jgi:hypothetical protein
MQSAAAYSDALPIPEFCDVCCSVNLFFDSGVWFCPDCHASVTCHRDTNIPLGRMADRQTRRLRILAHAEFDKLWTERLVTREKAYHWLSAQLEIELHACHIGVLNKDQLRDVITLSATYYRDNYSALVRRKEKRETKARKQVEPITDVDAIHAKQRRKRQYRR